jgi:hypothetical protein
MWINSAVLASRSGKPCRCALSQNLNSSLAQRIAMISVYDWDFASGSAAVVLIFCDDSYSQEGAAESIYFVVVSSGHGASV